MTAAPERRQETQGPGQPLFPLAAYWNPVSHPHREEFLQEQYRATRGIWKAALIVGAIVFGLRGFMDWVNGMASPNIVNEIIWRALGLVVQLGLILSFNRFTPARKGQFIVAAFLTTLSVGLVGNVYLNPVRTPYTLLPITFICMYSTALWLRTDGLIMTLTACLLPVAILMCSGLMSHIDVKSYAIYIPLSIILGLVLRRGRLAAAFDAFLLRKHLAAQALHDPLTGILNRAGWQDQLTATLVAGEPMRPSALLFFDLDKFKQINDTHGHPVGDALIRATAETIQSLLRSNDILARFGGEEFVVFLPGTGLEAAAGVAERIRTAIANQNRPVPATVSIGVCEFRLSETIDQALERADKALLLAKQAGRNRVTVAID